MNRPVIYTTGDSHCVNGWIQIPGIITAHGGPMTMYSWGLNKNRVCDRIPEDAIVCYSVGEIDCRNHVHKYQPWKETIDRLVEKYFEAVRADVVGRDPKSIWIYNVVPPIRSSEVLAENPNYPFVGTDVERVQYAKYMNKKLSETEFVFVDIYDKYSDSEGFMKFNLSDGHCHILIADHLKEWVDNYFNKETENDNTVTSA